MQTVWSELHVFVNEKIGSASATTVITTYFLRFSHAEESHSSQHCICVNLVFIAFYSINFIINTITLLSLLTIFEYMNPHSNTES